MKDAATWLRERAQSYHLDALRMDGDDAWWYHCMSDELTDAAKAFETDMKTVHRIEQDMGER